MAAVGDFPKADSPLMKRSASQILNLRLKTLKSKIQRTPISSTGDSMKAVARPKANTLAGNVAMKLKNAFNKKKVITERKISKPNDYVKTGGFDWKRGEDYVTIDWSTPVEPPKEEEEAAPKRPKRRRPREKKTKSKKEENPVRTASISYKTISYRDGPATKRLKLANLDVPVKKGEKKIEIDSFGLGEQPEQTGLLVPTIMEPERSDVEEEDGPEAKFKVISSNTYEYKVYPKELYPVVPVAKRRPSDSSQRRLRIRLLPTNVDPGGPNWEAKIREIMMTEPEGGVKPAEEPLYIDCESTATLTACTSPGEERLAPPTSLPLTLLRRSVDSAYSDDSPFNPADADHRPNMIFTNKKSTNSSESTPQTPFGRPAGHRASTSSSSMSSMDIDAPSPTTATEPTMMVPPPRKKERVIKKQNLGNSIKNFIKPTIDQRAQQFHKIFKGMVSTEENFVASYSCAFQREILAQGRLYLSDTSIAFAANIFGWETKHVIRFVDVVSIKRAKTAKIFANSIEIETKDQQKHFFASFANREKSYVLMYRLWQLIVTDVPLNSLTCKDPNTLLPPVTEMEHPAAGVVADDDGGGAKSLQLERTTTMLFNPPLPRLDTSSTPDVSLPDTEYPQQALEDDVTDSSDDEETNCTCKHEGKLYLDNVYDIGVERMREVMFGQTPWFHVYAAYLRTHPVHCKIIENISDYSQTPWRDQADENGKKKRCDSTYQLTVNHSMINKTITVNETLELAPLFEKLSQGFRIAKETRNQGVPYADYFTVKTSYCVTRISKSQCRLKVYGFLNFIKTPWGPIKGYMEKSTDAGLAERYRALDYCLTEDLKNSLEATSSISSRSAVEADTASTDDEEDEVDDKRDRTLTKAMAQEAAALPSTANGAIPGHPKTASIRRDLSTLSTTTAAQNPRVAIVDSISNFSPSIEFYCKVVIALLSTIVVLQLVQLWSTPRTSCVFSEDLMHFASQLRSPEILREQRVLEVRRSVGHLSEQLDDLMSLMRVRDET
ncbi:hypothetical protein QR680_008214 [Steinernema hermaphroditum]|uniref:VASt domain-containing protein n=1 Tax=Steinernema hermaphroditum TaxID=289476 RepID=A0AA39M6N1_9BILA|nr:hypothetical protein QR680_008214 [Steinernema hermaphroditum]